jgi:hypothetical protein
MCPPEGKTLAGKGAPVGIVAIGFLGTFIIDVIGQVCQLSFRAPFFSRYLAPTQRRKIPRRSGASPVSFILRATVNRLFVGSVDLRAGL